MKRTSLRFPKNLSLKSGKSQGSVQVGLSAKVGQKCFQDDLSIYANGMLVLRGVPAAFVLETIRRSILY